MKDLKGKIILITGGARGIGFSTAEYFGKAGCQLLLLDINKTELMKAKTKLGAITKNVHTFAIDISKKKPVDLLAKRIIKQFGHVDVLINNAGVGHTGELLATTPEIWNRLVNVNFWGVLNMTYAFLPSMVAKKNGHIVNVSSGQAFFRMPTWGAYASIKLAMACFSEVLGYEVKKHNIDVTTVYPFMVNTGFYEEVHPETIGGMLSMVLVPYYSMKPGTVGEIIFKAVREGRKVERVSVLNDLAYYGGMIPYFHDTMSRISNYILTTGSGGHGETKNKKKKENKK